MTLPSPATPPRSPDRPGAMPVPMVVRLVWSALLLAAAASASAQDGRPVVRRFTVDDGLGRNHVTGIAQDTTGFIWVGTTRGLQRFDGYTFTPVQVVAPGVPPALSGPVGGVWVDPHDRVWVAAEGGLYRFPARGGAAARVLGPGMIGGSRRGLIVLDSAEVIAIDWTAAAAEPHRVALLPECCEGLQRIALGESALWLASANMISPDGPAQVIRHDLHTGTRTVFRLRRVVTVFALLEAMDGRLWVTGYGGVEVLDPGAVEFRELPEFRGLDIMEAREDGHGGLFIPTPSELVRVAASGRILDRVHAPAAFTEAPISPRHLVVDREGGYWLGTVASGMLRIDPVPAVFGHASSSSTPPLAMTSDFVMALKEAPDGSLWVGTLGGGLYRLSGREVTAALRHDPHRPRSLPSDKVWGLEYDDAGALWIATDGGLCRIVGPGVECRRTLRPVFEPADVVRGPGGLLWFPLHTGVQSFDPATGRFGPELSLPGRMITVYADADSAWLWTAGTAVYRFRLRDGGAVGEAEAVGAQLQPGDGVSQVRRTRDGQLWLASTRGLQRWDAAAHAFVVIDVPGLHDVSVFSIIEDDGGRLWLGTSHGLVEYVPATRSARRYRRADGVLSGEFNRRAALRLRSGSMVFGGMNGLTFFEPERVHASRAVAPTVFTRWRRVTADGASDETVDGSAIRVGPRDRSFALEFASLTFRTPAARYRYRLRGLSDDWIETSEHVVTYATPPPGRYTFEVQTAAGAEGMWTEPGAALLVQVVPPFWRTTPFRLLLLVLLGAVLWSLHRLRVRQAIATERLRLAISRDLHDEIGAGLSGIALLSDALGGDGALRDADRDELRRIGQSARTMATDLRDIVWAIDPDGDRVADVVARMHDVAGQLLRGVRFTFHAPDGAAFDERIGMTARRDLLRIYREVLHNVARHAGAGAVEIRVEAGPDAMDVIIADDGVGFDASSVRAGTGLRSMRERADRIGAHLEITSRPAGGTAVRLRVPRT